MFQYAFLVCAGLTTVYYLAFVSQLTSANTVESQSLVSWRFCHKEYVDKVLPGPCMLLTGM